MPALPLDDAGKYVAGAYLVFVALVLVYLAIMGAKLQRLDRDLSKLVELEQKRTNRTKKHDTDPDGGAGD